MHDISNQRRVFQTRTVEFDKLSLVEYNIMPKRKGIQKCNLIKFSKKKPAISQGL